MHFQLSEHTDQGKYVLDLYKGNSPHLGVQCFADHINNCLRNNVPLEGPWEQVIETFDLLFTKSTLSCATLLYRATVDDFVVPYLINGEYVYPAYMSTATNEHVVQSHFSSVFKQRPAALLKIRCPTGTPALDLEFNPNFGGHEREVLLPRSARFKVCQTIEMTDQNEMAYHMSAQRACNFSLLKVYELEYLGHS